MKANFNVKNDSVQKFFEENLLNAETMTSNRNDCSTQSAYYRMKNEFLFKKNCKFAIGEKIQIQLFDVAEKSRKVLINKYIYEIEPYDDVAVKIVLKDFDVQLSEEQPERTDFHY